jgi:hypothetical protein
MNNGNFQAVTYNNKGLKSSAKMLMATFATEQEALDYLKERAQAYLDGGEYPRYLDDWHVAFVTHNIARVTHTIKMTQIPFENPVLVIEVA